MATKRTRPLPDEATPRRKESRLSDGPKPGADEQSSSRHVAPTPGCDSPTTGSTCDKKEGPTDKLQHSPSPSSPSSSPTPAPPEPVVEVIKETVIALEADEEEERAMSDMLPRIDYPLLPIVKKDERQMENKSNHSYHATTSSSSDKTRSNTNAATDGKHDSHAGEKGEKKNMEVDLPHPWRETKSSKGKIYYFNPETGAAVWDRPSPPLSSSPSSSSSAATTAVITTDAESRKRNPSSSTASKHSSSTTFSRVRQDEKRPSDDHYNAYHHGHHDRHRNHYHHDGRYRRPDYSPLRYRYPPAPPSLPPALPVDYRRPSTRDIFPSSGYRDRFSGGGGRRR
ncbi:hypothetical protein BCR43DRAFT_500846 [Syncephalastrum racemosum]|uniref:WW domain-containing protein n=1 Tax=Syncephalastrum racemosum TaxID=13706 RepID=A0A1X2HUU9_SYNRA|nr:hypothetical protein BCR43DRAFT_500846 [Syncephalastrum racemosum]